MWRRVGDDGAVVDAPSLRGKLLVATPPLEDANFDRSVVLMLEHSDDGALGVILNRPTGNDVGEMLEAWAPYAAQPRVLFHGGPVEPSAVIGLARMGSSESSDDWEPVFGRLGTIDLRREPDAVEPGVELLRLFVGYAGWGAGQLESELSLGAWIVAEAHPDDAFADEPEDLWRAVLGRQRGRTSWLATYPDDPEWN
jgi:putative transcriptional regulator